jgi:hypothetical protein
MAVISATPIAGNSTSMESNDENRSAVFYSTNPTGDFNASGTLASIIGMDLANPEYIIAGKWNLVADGGNISSFNVHFTMVSSNGTERHTHTLANFTPNAAIPLILDDQGATFTGMADIKTDDKATWYGVQVTATISKHDTIKIMLNQEQVNNHLKGQPIYGIVYSIRDVS